MSDSRCKIKIEFEIYGQKYPWEASLNYSDNGYGMDDRITAFFVRSYKHAYENYQRQNYILDREERQKSEELATLTALRLKYPDA